LNPTLQEIVQEQITRVLLERLIVNRPHPWGLLITFIELIKNPRCAPCAPRRNSWLHARPSSPLCSAAAVVHRPSVAISGRQTSS
jgi:CCR4-Not complex component, Not1